MSEMNNNINLDSDLSQILDTKSDRIQFGSDMPAPEDGQDGEIRVGIRFKNKTLMATKVEGFWHFIPMMSINSLLSEESVKPNVKLGSSRKPHRNSNILTEIVTGTTHAISGRWVASSALSYVTGDNIVGIVGSIELSNEWHSFGSTLAAVTDDPSYCSVKFKESDNTINVQTNDSSLQELPFRVVVFYRNKDFS